MLKDIGFLEFWISLLFVFILQTFLVFAGSWIASQVVKIRIKLGYAPYGTRSFFSKENYTPLCRIIPMTNYHLVVVDYDDSGATLRETFYSIIATWITCEHEEHQKTIETAKLSIILSNLSVIPTFLVYGISIIEKDLNSLSFGIINIFPKEDTNLVIISLKYFVVAGFASFLSGGLIMYVEMFYVQKNN